jgi:EAL domain-containing protein (putative c-di-GMP-specific phosphodiesterase class I)/GGDEF domain-containing protein
MVKRLMENKNMHLYTISISYIASIILAFVVFFTGGTSKVYANLMYIPIGAISSTNGKKVGVIHAFISALLIGPFMPLNVELNISQQPINWITRLLIYITMALTIGFFSDYNKKNQEYITNLLTHDAITNLKNVESLKYDINDSQNRTIIALTVKGYEQTLRLFGHNFTKKCILNFSKRLNDEIKGYDNVELYKYDGMEFILVITEKEEGEVSKEIIKLLKNVDKNTLIVDDIPIYIEILTGITNINENTSTIEGVRQALIALRYAISNNIRMKNYDETIDIHYKSIVDIAAEFNSALANKNIKAAFQNIYDSKTGEAVGVELLARWIGDNGVQIRPFEFIPVIENTELINKLAKFMIDKAIEYISRCDSKDKVVSINFSPKDLNEDNVWYLLNRIEQNELDYSRFKIEVTEEVFLEINSTINYLNIIREKGILIAMDDFGKGYSSYQQIGEIPLDIIKIDKSIISKICYSQVSNNLAEGIVYLCKNNGIKTVAEGVESKEVADACKAIGIDYLQGFYYHMPAILE